MQQEAGWFEAVRSGDLATVERLLGLRPDLARRAGEHGKTGLHWAAESDQAEAARLLLDAGADLEARTSWGATPLDWAAVMGSARVGELLFARGASGLTLVVAAGLGMLDQVRRLSQPPVDVRAQRRRGAPDEPDGDWPADAAHLRGDVLSDALYAAARNGHANVVAHLLDRGADVDAKGVFGATALHWAAYHGHRATAELLLARGARTDLRDARFAATPADWAREGGHGGLAAAMGGAAPA